METQPCCCQHFLCVCQNKAASQLFYQRSSPPCHSLCCIPVVTAKTTPIRLGSASHRTEKKKKKEGVLHPSHKGIAHCICGSMPSTTVTSKTPSKYYKQPSWKRPFRMSFFKFLKFYLPATPTDSSYWSCILAYSYKDINHTHKLQHTHEVI